MDVPGEVSEVLVAVHVNGLVPALEERANTMAGCVQALDVGASQAVDEATDRRIESGADQEVEVTWHEAKGDDPDGV
jgi:hypothetical protein